MRRSEVLCFCSNPTTLMRIGRCARRGLHLFRAAGIHQQVTRNNVFACAISTALAVTYGHGQKAAIRSSATTSGSPVKDTTSPSPTCRSLTRHRRRTAVHASYTVPTTHGPSSGGIQGGTLRRRSHQPAPDAHGAERRRFPRREPMRRHQSLPRHHAGRKGATRFRICNWTRAAFRHRFLSSRS